MNNALIALLVLTAPLPAADPPGAQRWQLRLRTRTGNGAVAEKVAKWPARRTAVIVCDMWDDHWCRGAARRVRQMAPKLDAFLDAARDKGALIIHAPSDCMDAYADHPARKRARAAKVPDDTPAFLARHAQPLEAEKDADPAILAAGCDCPEPCKPARPWTRQIGAIRIDDADAITDSGREVRALLAARGIENVLVTGVHTNLCVLNRPFGLRNLARAGVHVALVRDLTDAMVAPAAAPDAGHFRRTELVVAYIERHICPTLVSTDVTGEARWHFPGDIRPHVVFVIGEREYKTRRTLPAFAAAHLAGRGLRRTFVHAASDSHAARKHLFPGFEAVGDADLVWISVRRRGLKPARLDLLRAHLSAGKALIGIRTASHAFHTRGRHPKGHAEWKAFDPEVLGGHYHGHHSANHTTTVTPADGAGGHAILAGVRPFRSAGSLYKARPLAEAATPLLIGAIENAEPEPVAWTHRYGKARVFYTSLGHPEDFEDPNFTRLLTNATAWVLGRGEAQTSR